MWSIKDDPLSNLISLLWGLEECLTRLPIPVFRNPFFEPPKPIPARISEDFFFRGISSQECGVEGVLKIPVFSHFYKIFLQEFLWDRNSCICTGFLRIPPDSCSCQKLSGLDQRLKKALCEVKFGLKFTFFNLFPKQDLTMASAAPVVLCWHLPA